jgi:hypothetical protein
MNNSLARYAIGVVAALAVMLVLTWLVAGEAHVKTSLVFALGFLAGMLSMYIKGRLLGVF